MSYLSRFSAWWPGVGGALRRLGKFEWAGEETLSGNPLFLGHLDQEVKDLETEDNWRKLMRKEVQAKRVGVKLTCSNLDGTKD